MSETHASFWYQHLVGLLFFIPGLLLGFRLRAWSFRPAEQGPFWLLIAMWLSYLAIQGFFEFVAPTIG